ncbi:MAG TPA: hypothetical protein PLH22_01945 [Candidatus Colwellbacteria bacterium]|nr:hypothetical protein [Candidatus Colwellbacteria bacterium]
MPEYSLKTPICPPSLINTNYFYYIKSRLYSNADKCTNIASSNQCLVNEQNKGLWSGSCEGGSGNFYKCCCNNQTNSPVSSVPYYGETNDNYPPPEGVCPIGSRREWRNGAEINPNECANICNPPPPPDPTAPLFCDLSQNCKYGTLEELGVSPVLASIRLDDKTLRKDISQEKCLYLCRDVYTCEDKTLVPQKGKYTSHEECVAGTGFECFGPNDTEYRDCPEGTVSGIGFWRFDPDLNSCVFAGSFENQAECEETFGICYATKEECEGSLKQFYRCDPVYSCLSTKFESEDQCKAKYGTCYDFLNSCMSSCRTSGGESCNLPSDTGSGLTLTVQDNENHCVTATDNQATITWNAASSASCGPGETKENQEITCRSLCGNWTTKTSSGGQEDVNPARTTEYGIQCELDYECCTYTDVYGEPYDCDVNGQNCKRDVIGTDRDCSDHSASRSRKTEVRVVGKPTINEFSSNPTDILYSSGEIGLRKYSTLEWNASADYLGSKTALSCNMSIVSGDSSSRTGTNPLLSQGEERAIPQITTNYSLICRNKDDVSVPDPSCFLDSDPEEALVRVFGAGIREEGPPAGTFKGIDSLFGEIVKAFTLFREGQWPQY